MEQRWTPDAAPATPGTPTVSSARWATQQMIMGLPFSVHLRGTVDPDARRLALDQVWADLERADQLFSTYRPDSEISRLARGELDEAAADTEVVQVLALAEDARQATGGSFDVHFAGPLDPSGIVKGWAAERSCRHLRRLGVDFYLNAGGDILAHALDPGVPWTLGIEHPDDTGELFAVFQVGDAALATSGSTHRGDHIRDPATGAAAPARRQATVIGPSLTSADVWATAAVVSGERVVEAAGWPSGYELLLREPDGTVLATAGTAALLAPGHPSPRIDRIIGIIDPTATAE